jgi:hypothetical protein
MHTSKKNEKNSQPGRKTFVKLIKRKILIEQITFFFVFCIILIFYLHKNLLYILCKIKLNYKDYKNGNYGQNNENILGVYQ